MKILKPESDFHAGSTGQLFKEILEWELAAYPEIRFCLDLSDVLYMDTYTFRLVFDNMPKFDKIIPPISNKVIEVYDIWVDSKKGLSK